jgi:hypothetical protein
MTYLNNNKLYSSEPRDDRQEKRRDGDCGQGSHSETAKMLVEMKNLWAHWFRTADLNLCGLNQD